jgi:hypothetical protein
MKLEFSRQIFEKEARISSFIKIRPVEIDLFHADRQKDGHDEANRRFSQFCEKRLKTEEAYLRGKKK